MSLFEKCWCLLTCSPSAKAIAWCPWQSNLLATGGGANDKTIKFWNASTGQCLNSVDAKSQVGVWMFEYLA